MLSLFFLGRSLIDLLYAWNLIQINLHNPDISIIQIVITELAPTFIITYLIKSKNKKSKSEDLQNNSHSPSKYSKSKAALHIVSPVFEKNTKEKLLTREDM